VQAGSLIWGSWANWTCEPVTVLFILVITVLHMSAGSKSMSLCF
jgi:hypothetical protein